MTKHLRQRREKNLDEQKKFNSSLGTWVNPKKKHERRFNGFQPQNNVCSLKDSRDDSAELSLRMWQNHIKNIWLDLTTSTTTTTIINHEKLFGNKQGKNRVFCRILPRHLYTWLELHKNIFPVIFIFIEWCCDFSTFRCCLFSLSPFTQPACMTFFVFEIQRNYFPSMKLLKKNWALKMQFADKAEAIK